MSKFSIRAAYCHRRDDLSSIIIQPPSIDFEDVAKEMRKTLAVKGFCVNKSAKFLTEILTFIPGRALCSPTIAGAALVHVATVWTSDMGEHGMCGHVY